MRLPNTRTFRCRQYGSSSRCVGALAVLLLLRNLVVAGTSLVALALTLGAAVTSLQAASNRQASRDRRIADTRLSPRAQPW